MTKTQQLTLELLAGDGHQQVSPTAAFEPRRLTSARNLRGMTKKRLAEEIHRTAAVITQYESGDSKPTADIENLLERTLNVRRGYFTAGRTTANAGLESLSFRAPARTNLLYKRQALEVARLGWEIRHALANHVNFPPLTFDIPETPNTTSTPEQAALALRAEWGLGWEPIHQLVRLMEVHGITTFDVPDEHCNPHMDAYSYADPAAPIVVLVPQRKNGNAYRRRFTAAHELGHLIMHGTCDGHDALRESEADRFAAEFLAPQRALHNQLPKRFDIRQLTAISDYWGISTSAITYRCKEISHISETTARRWFQRLNSMREQGELSEPHHTTFPGEQPVTLRKATRLAAEQSVTVADIAHRLRIPTNTVAAICSPDTQVEPQLAIVS